MMRKKKQAPFLPILLIFIILNTLFIAGRSLWERIGADRNVLIIGNLFIAAIVFISFLISQKGIRNPNTHAFMRSVYSGILIKLFTCIIGAFIYIAAAGKDLNKPALFVCMGLYLLYTFVEVSILMKQLKERSNAETGSTP
jgi:hypothetical protein